MLRVLSLGAGVQSTTMALMAAHGEIAPVDCAIFANTGDEPAAVYEHLRWLMSPNVLPFPIHLVSNGRLRDNIERGSQGKRWASIPAYTRTGRVRQLCTSEFKIVPMTRLVRELAGLYRKRSPKTPVVEMLIGISKDEAHREKPSPNEWQKFTYPLLDLGMSRQDCLRWMREHQYPEPPKSACIFCPNRSDTRWREMRDNRPDEWAAAIAIDQRLRSGFRGMRQPMFLHSSARPLAEADLSDLFAEDDHGNECGGHCGV